MVERYNTEVQNRLEGYLPVSGLLAIMSMGIVVKQRYDVLALRLSVKYNRLRRNMQ